VLILSCFQRAHEAQAKMIMQPPELTEATALAAIEPFGTADETLGDTLIRLLKEEVSICTAIASERVCRAITTVVHGASCNGRSEGTCV
jgi:hypothetical protein